MLTCAGVRARIRAETSLRCRTSDGSDALLPIGFGLAGIAADHLGTAPVFLLGGTLGAAIIALGLLHPMVRHMD